MSNARRIFHSRVTAVVVSAIVTGAAFGATKALASHDVNTLHACANKQTGSLRLVGVASDCRENETPVEYSRQGPAGPAGSLGLAGQRCAQGQFVVGFAADGSLLCQNADPPAGGGGASSPSDVDGDGFSVSQGDCNDNDPSMMPGAPEVFDGKDNDCDGQIDDPVSATALNETNSESEADACWIANPASLSLAPGQSAPVSGRVSEAGSTGQSGPLPAQLAQLGVGPSGSDPRSYAGWTYWTAAFNGRISSEHEYVASLAAPSATGSYSYVYRFSFDGGDSYTYCDLDGAGSSPGLDFSPTKLGVLHVMPS